MNNNGVVIVDGIRTPFTKAGTLFNKLTAVDLGRIVVSEVIQRLDLDPELIDEVIMGNIAQPPEATNIARVIALKSGIPKRKPAFTVQRNCASAMQSIVDAYLRITAGLAEVIIAGGVESMSNIPIIYPKSYANVLAGIAQAKTPMQKLSGLTQFRPKHFKPIIGLEVGLTDGVCGLNMGETAEVLAKENKISRMAQDEFALMSHQRSTEATAEGKLKDELVPVHVPPRYNEVVDEDNGIRKQQSIEALQKLRPYFDRKFGSVTAGNSSQITDGAAVVVVMSQARAKELGYKPLGLVRSFGFAGLEPERMGLGPAFATPVALEHAGIGLKDVQLIEINEAFAAQVIANEIAFRSKEFAAGNFGYAEAIGELDRSITNVNGGAIALGHPVGATGSRLVLTLLKEMERRDLELGLATLCIGGGQGGAMIVERK